MDSSEKITTPIATMQYIDGILYIDILPKNVSLEEAKEHQEIEYKHFSQYYPVLMLTDARKMKQMSKPVRDYLASPEVSATIKAGAIVIGSGIAKITGNLFLQFSKPLCPTKLFTSKEQAEEWLNSLR